MDIAAGLRVALAPNPGPMTGPGTNQYLLHDRGEALLIDAAPLDDENRERMTATGVRPTALLLTHIHPDHVGGAAAVRETWRAPVAVHRSRAEFVLGGVPLAPDRLVEEGDEIAFPGGRLRAIHTPGHESGHCCYYEPERRWLFTGDTILSTGTTIIAPPDGNMTDYLDSLRRLRALDLDVILPAHGPPITRPYDVIDEYLSHRLLREQQVLDALGDGLDEIPPIVARLYADLHPVLHWAAALTVQAHLEKLVRDGRVRGDAARWSLVR
jgi:glyoxylase-like metal-dependent hydrolase (beta-lactamase superfamily II)